MNTESGPVRWGPNGPVVDGPFIVVKESGPVKWGHNGDGVVDLAEFDDDMLLDEFRQREKDRRFFNAHQPRLSEQYLGMYVAIYREELAAVAATRKELAQQLKSKGIRPGTSYWQFLPTEPIILIPTAWKITE